MIEENRPANCHVLATFAASDVSVIQASNEVYRRFHGGRPAIKVISTQGNVRNEIIYDTDSSGKRLVSEEGIEYTLTNVPEQVENVGTILSPNEITVPAHQEKKLYAKYSCDLN